MLARLVAGASYPAVVTRVVDGDTIHADIVLGTLEIPTSRVRLTLLDEPVRLGGCNAAERYTDGGKAARLNLTNMLPPGIPITLSAVSDYKYGGEIVAAVTMPDGSDLVTYLVAQQWVAAWDNTGPRPIPPWPRTVLG